MGTSSRVVQGSCGDEILSQILDAITTYEQCDPFDLPPLYETIDPDVLGQVVEGVGVTEVSFSYQGYRVSIEDVGDVRVVPERK